MKNRKKYWIPALAALFALLVLGALLFACGGKEPTEAAFTQTVTVRSGIAEPEGFALPPVVHADGHDRLPLDVPEGGRYRLKLQWKSAPGLLIGARLVNEDGEVFFAVTGESLDAESESLRLAAGAYTLEFASLTNAEAVAAFAAESIAPLQQNAGDPYAVTDAAGKSSDIRAYAFAADGTWEIRCSLTFGESKAFSAGKKTGVLVGALLGFVLLFVILILTKKDRNIHAKFDERQQLARGKGYRLGFWTAFGYFGLLLLCGVLDIKIPADPAVIAFIGMVLSGFAFAAYCIWTDAYFALNENRKTLCITVTIMGAVNILLGVLNLIGGRAIVDGVLTYRAMNLLCGVLLALIGAVLLAAKLRDDRKAKAAAEEEDA